MKRTRNFQFSLDKATVTASVSAPDLGPPDADAPPLTTVADRLAEYYAENETAEDAPSELQPEDLPTRREARTIVRRVVGAATTRARAEPPLMSSDVGLHMKMFTRRMMLDGHGRFRESAAHISVQAAVPSEPMAFLVPPVRELVRELRTYVKLQDLASMVMPRYQSQVPSSARSDIITSTELGTLCTMITKKVPSTAVIGSKFGYYRPAGSTIHEVLHAFVLFSVDSKGTFAWCLMMPVEVAQVMDDIEVPPFTSCTPLQLERDQAFRVTVRRPFYPFIVPCACYINEANSRKCLHELPKPPERVGVTVPNKVRRLDPEQVAPKESTFGVPVGEPEGGVGD